MTRKTTKASAFSLFQDTKSLSISARPNACKYVDYWNSLQYTSKVRYGKNTYHEVSAFFHAYKKYQIGYTQKYILTDKYKQMINLTPVDNIQRSDIEIYKHMEIASLAFDPAYYPGNKAFLKGTAFFYTQYSKLYQYRSLFLEFVVNPPSLLDEAVEKKREEEIPATVKFICDKIYKLYDLLDEPLDDSQKTRDKVIMVAKSVDDMWGKIPSGISIIDRHFNSHEKFVALWYSFVTNNAWIGMPVGALHVEKDMWRKFITVTSKEIGVHLLTGDRL